jgi:hypothetical protein
MYHYNYKIWAGILLVALATVASAQTTYDSTSLVDTNNTSTTTVTSTNTNTNTNTSTSTSTNTNVNTSTSTSTNTNVNTNNNVNSGDQTIRNVSSGEVTNRNINTTTMEVKQPPPTAIAPAMMSGGNSDLCTTGTSGAVQTQILGISSGGTVRDMNCERLKNAKTLYDMGMKVAAVATLCQDRRVFDAMWHAGTPCPYEGQIGDQARALWQANPDRMPRAEEQKPDEYYKKVGFGALIGALLFKLF